MFKTSVIKATFQTFYCRIDHIQDGLSDVAAEMQNPRDTLQHALKKTKTNKKNNLMS